MTAALEAIGITKQFPGVLANDRVNFALEKGEIHALLGENGAGKTTLMNILYGLYQQDSGQIRVDGREVHLSSPDDAIHLGIGMVHQHFMLIPVFTVAENVMLGAEVVQNAMLDRRRAQTEIRELSAQYGLDIDPAAYVKDLPVGTQQRVEIIKALYRHADILILDEPTAVLTPQEARELFRIMRSLTAQGKSIIFISHKLKEVLEIADRVTVMRRGRVVGTTTPKEVDEAHLASMMVGREVILTVEKGPAHPDGVILNIEDLSVCDDRGHQIVDGVSFEIRGGEILGIAGVQGNGQTELVEALTGLRPSVSGRFTILGRDMTNHVPRAVIEKGVAHIPEDRQRDGLVLPFPVADNFALMTYYLPPLAHGIQIDEPEIRRHATALAEQYDVRTPNVVVPAGTLSGGNQQKVIVARELSRNVRLVIASQPTRGLDVGSIEFIHKNIVEMRDRGVAVLLVSAELDEILSLSDRIAVIYKGRILATLNRSQATRENLGLLMAGVETAAPADGRTALPPQGMGAEAAVSPKSQPGE